MTLTAGPAPPEQLLIGHIQAHIKQGEKAKERADKNHKKSEDHFIAAGTYLITLKVNYAPTWQAWESLLKIKVKLSTGRASKLMQLADGRKDLQQIRDEKAQSVARLREHGSSLQPNVVKKAPRDEEEEKARIATAPDKAAAPSPSAIENDAGINDPRPLINALAISTPIARKLAVAAVVEGVRQFQFEQVRDAVVDLYQRLAKAGR
jgi:hypothetical protein